MIKKFLEKIFEFFQLDEKEKIKLLEENIILKEQNNSLKKEINKVCEFEKWCDDKYTSVNMYYTKRWVFKNSNKVPYDVRDFIKYYHILPNLLTLENIFKYKIKYVYDKFEEHGMLDFWQTAIETEKLKKGDCDDSGILRACLSRKISNDNIFCAIGYYGTTGHLFNVTLENDKLVILENTSNTYAPKQYEGSPYKILYLFNENKCWFVNGTETEKKNLAKEFGIKVE